MKNVRIALVCSLFPACALAPPDDEHAFTEEPAEIAASLRVDALRAFGHPIGLTLRDATRDEEPTVVFTREGFVFRLMLTTTGASIVVENMSNAPLNIGHFRLSAGCGGSSVSGAMGRIHSGQRYSYTTTCKDGATASFARLEVETMASAASDIDFWLPTLTPPGGAELSFSNFPTQLNLGDGSRASLERIDADAIAGTFTNGTAVALAVRLTLNGVCPEARFDQPTTVDTDMVRVRPGDSLTTFLRCINGAPTPTLTVRTSLWQDPSPSTEEARDAP